MNILELTDNTVLWQMSMAERATIFHLLGKLPKRGTAIEIGSYKGGFTRVLSKHFNKVYSLDIDHSNIVDKDSFGNVEWITGDSKETLPKLILELDEIDFILIDGDHSYEAVLQDIQNVLEYVPKSDTILLIHDSWYEPSRNAINRADWNGCPYVHYIEKDLVTGDAHGRVLVGGLALVLLSAEPREGNVEILQTHDYLYRICKRLLDEQWRRSLKPGSLVRSGQKPGDQNHPNRI